MSLLARWLNLNLRAIALLIQSLDRFREGLDLIDCRWNRIQNMIRWLRVLLRVHQGNNTAAVRCVIPFLYILQCIRSVNRVFPRRGRRISIAFPIRSLDPRLPGLVCRKMVGFGLFIIIQLKTSYATLFKRNGIRRLGGG